MPSKSGMMDKSSPSSFMPSEPSSETVSTLYPSSVSREFINQLLLGRYEGPIYMVRTQEELALAVEDLSQESLIGFDTETRPSFQRGTNYPVSLVQMAGCQGVYLFHLPHIKDLSPLDRILGDPNIKKACVAVRDDVRKLQAYHPFQDAGFVEIGEAAHRAGITQTGLRSLCAILLGVRISKSAQVSNWARLYLSHAQIIYAATDAWVSRLLYKKLSELPEHCAKPPENAPAQEPQPENPAGSTSTEPQQS